MQRKEAMQQVINVGGTPQKGINKMTNVLVVRQEDPKFVGPDGNYSKKRAEKLLSEGSDIQVIGKDDFQRMIKNNMNFFKGSDVRFSSNCLP